MARTKAPDLCPDCGASWDCEHSARKPEKRAPDEADRIAGQFAEAAAVGGMIAGQGFQIVS